MSTPSQPPTDALCSNGQFGAGMVNYLVVQADSEFKQGNFAESSRLYAEALEDSSSAAKEVATLLQKLGDSEYAQNNYTQARQSYERLVELHESGNFGNKDKVNALLKLAKCNDRCEDKEAAKTRFQAAYDLATSGLSAKHYLRRTVLDSYAEWLRIAADDFDLLHAIEDELGVQRTSPIKEEAPIDEVTPESVSVPDVQGASAPKEKEFFVLKTKLTKFKKEKAQSEQEKQKKKIEAQKLTLDQQVAERKFLRKGSEADNADARSNRRAKLRGALSDTGRSTASPTGQEAQAAMQEQTGQLATSGVNPQVAQSPAAAFTSTGEYAHLDGNVFSTGEHAVVKSDSQKQFDLLVNPGATEQPTLAKFAGKTPRRHFSDRLEEVSRKKKGVDLIVPTQSTGMAEKSRSFLQHSDAVKKADPSAEPARDLEQLRTEELEVVRPKNVLATGLKAGGPAVAILLLAVASIYLLAFSGRVQNTSSVPYYLSPLVGKTFIAADSALSICVAKNSVTVQTAGKKTTAKLRLWNGSWLDELSLLTGGYKNCRWLYIVAAGLRDQNGTTFYAPDSPERQVIAFMDTVATEAQRFYAINGDYPNYSTDIDVHTYENPFSKKEEPVIIFSGVNEKVDAEKDSVLDTTFKSGTLFNNETALGPGAVHALSVIGHPLPGGDSGTYNWAVHCFYIHGCDGDGKMLPGSEPGKIFLRTLKNGIKIQSTTDPNYAGQDFCLSQSTPPDPTLVMWKYLGGFIIVIIFIGVAMRSTRIVKRR